MTTQQTGSASRPPLSSLRQLSGRSSHAYGPKVLLNVFKHLPKELSPTMPPAVLVIAVSGRRKCHRPSTVPHSVLLFALFSCASLCVWPCGVCTRGHRMCGPAETPHPPSRLWTCRPLWCASWRLQGEGNRALLSCFTCCHQHNS